MIDNVQRYHLRFGLIALLVSPLVACSGNAIPDPQQQLNSGTAGAANGNTTSAQGGNTTTTGGNAGGDAGAGGDSTQVIDCSSPNVGASPLRRLTREQYDNTLRDLLGVTSRPSVGLSADEKITLFYSNAISPMTRLGAEQYGDVAEQVARTATTNVDALVACDRMALGDAACTSQFITNFGLRAFRRPLLASEIASYQALYDAYAARGFAEGIRLVLQAFLQSPHFLYHLELSTEPAPVQEQTIPLDSYQVASRLSYALWNSTPDPALLEAAKNGELSSKEGVLVAATRLLDDDKARDALSSFHNQWLGLERLADTQKDPALFPEFDATLKTAMANETTAFVDHVIRKGDGRLTTLLSAPFTMADPALYALYGSSTPAADGTLPLNPNERAGLLTQLSFLATHAHANQGSPVHRGVTVRRNLLCNPLPDPPPNVNNIPPNPAPNATTRERFDEHTTNPTCASCHTLIDPIGFGFENYDAVGRYRSVENGIAIDASGELTLAGSVDGPFVGAVALANKLSTSDQVRSCVQKQWFRFALGRTETDQDTCTMTDLSAQFAATDYNIKSLLLALVSSDSFRFRKEQP